MKGILSTSYSLFQSFWFSCKDQVIAKIHRHDFCIESLSLINDCLTERKHRVRISNPCGWIIYLVYHKGLFSDHYCLTYFCVFCSFSKLILTLFAVSTTKCYAALVKVEIRQLQNQQNHQKLFLNGLKTMSLKKILTGVTCLWAETVVSLPILVKTKFKIQKLRKSLGLLSIVE